MADEKKKVSGLTELEEAPAVDDWLPVVDISDTTQAPSGSTKKMTVARLAIPATPPTTTAANDMQVGNGSGAWIKKTLAEMLVILLNKAAGSDLIAGTDDAKWATAKALKDGGFIKTTLIGAVAHKQFWIGNAKPTLTAGCAASAQIEMGTNKNVYDYLAFDASTIEYAYANVAMPQDYTGGTVYAQFYWLHPATTTNFKVSWGLQAVSFSNDDTLDAAQGTAIYSNDEGGTTSDLYISPQTTAITIAGTPVAGDYVNWRISRKADDGTNDTLAVDAYLLGYLVWYPVA